VSPWPGELVLNIGDMLQRLTNGKLRSTTHRVVNPTPGRASKARYSMPFFLHFRSDFLIDALPETVPAGEQPKWPPITANDYLQERLREIKLV
jgi:isopenicillin N synthase-like dioxygenase